MIEIYEIPMPQVGSERAPLPKVKPGTMETLTFGGLSVRFDKSELTSLDQLSELLLQIGRRLAVLLEDDSNEQEKPNGE